jgi:hypothetical protein
MKGITEIQQLLYADNQSGSDVVRINQLLVEMDEAQIEELDRRVVVEHIDRVLLHGAALIEHQARFDELHDRLSGTDMEGRLTCS